MRGQHRRPFTDEPLSSSLSCSRAFAGDKDAGGHGLILNAIVEQSLAIGQQAAAGGMSFASIRPSQQRAKNVPSFAGLFPLAIAVLAAHGSITATLSIGLAPRDGQHRPSPRKRPLSLARPYLTLRRRPPGYEEHDPPPWRSPRRPAKI